MQVRPHNHRAVVKRLHKEETAGIVVPDPDESSSPEPRPMGSGNRLRIAQIAPLYERVPPKLYGGTERVVSYLTEELVRQGHDVTLFASGDSQTSAELVPCCDMALRLNPVREPLPYHVIMMEEVRQRADMFDVLHFHLDFLHAPLVRDFTASTLTTLHGRLDLPDLPPFYARFNDLPLVSISNDQRTYLRQANWVGTVHHGIPRDLLPFQPNPSGDYLAYLGRIALEKRPDLAIEIAAKAGMPLKIAAKVDRVDQAYWEEKIRPMVEAHSNVEFIGEINEHEEARFLGDAVALIFPIDWPEPFGLVMIEAMACGTPVIAFPRGSVPEIIEPDSGVIVDNVERAVEAAQSIGRLDRSRVRAAFEARFTAERMARDYVAIYTELAALRDSPARGQMHQFHRKPALRAMKADAEIATNSFMAGQMDAAQTDAAKPSLQP